MAWLKALNPAGIIEELKHKLAWLQEQWRGTRSANERKRLRITRHGHAKGVVWDIYDIESCRDG